MDHSDDSDFYGDDETVMDLHRRVQDFDVQSWMLQQQQSPGRPLPRKNIVADTSHLHNPYAGVHYAWQLTETVDEFLTRLPPKTTDITEDTPWIYICNPYIARVEKSLAQNQHSKGNEDEAPEEEGSKTELVMEGGLERLELLSRFIEGVQRSTKVPAVQEREMNAERKRASGDILHLAHAARVRAGKWMLFCPPAEVNDVWDIIAKATANNELGIAAKVAPRPVDEDSRKDRLICVYTADFADKADVGRVLQRLRELRLVEIRGRPIYYKPDAYTYIGISFGNPWGLKASIYKSSDIFQT
ncbi:hypothetical protein FLAG1_08117 [Fusarium langsethiae]|uniref:DUF1917-domain-containing protein n=1 Tax=Fusarium langsethiae TaxID=179993 RepID=A0A0M9ET15_FUSLA|nr:hypothetical protein FLAG1_08117 [Fusarium langsethiae]GKU05408.1 unnamed protein product [Fusarium langsethiae]GKU22133.1 unnamed protein product [Fusarium langsethiae]